MASVDVGVGLLGYGTVGSSVSRMLAESRDEIDRATGHRLTTVRALVCDPAKERAFSPGDGALAHGRLRSAAGRPARRSSPR